MSQQESDKAPVIFHDVAAYFSEEEWKLLDEWQKELYQNVMKEIHQALISLGHHILNPDALLRIYKGEAVHFQEQPDLGRGAAHKDPALSYVPAANPDILLKIKYEDHPHGSEKSKVDTSSSAAHVPAANPDILLKIKYEDHPHGSEKSKVDTSSNAGFLLHNFNIVKNEEESNDCFMDEYSAKAIETHAGLSSGHEILNRKKNNGNDFMCSDTMTPSKASSGKEKVNVPHSFKNRLNSRSHLCSEFNRKVEEENTEKCKRGFMSSTHSSLYSGIQKVDISDKYSECKPNMKHVQLPMCLKTPQQNWIQHKCTESENRFMHNTGLVRPQKTHMENERLHQCTECEESFSLKGQLISHQKTHMEEKPYQCTECDKYFCQKKLLNRHQKTHLEVRPYQCTECEKNYCVKGQLLIHQKTHTGEKAYQCTECEKCFSQKGHLIRHRKTHTGERPYQCTECEKNFSVKGSLIRHHKVHMGERPHQCTECKKMFSRKEHLIVHQRRHTGERPYPCTHCDKSFSHKLALLCHERTHTGERPYQCTKCDKSFSQRGTLISHQRTHR